MVSEKSKRNIKHNIQAYSFIFPNLLLFLACSIYPLLWALKYVFYQYGGFGYAEPRWVGLENFARVMRDKIYWRSVGNTFVYGFGKVLIILPMAFTLALLLNRKRRGNGLMQSLIFLPTIMSSAVMGLVFYLLFNVYNGEINKYLLNLRLITNPISWFGKENAMKTLIAIAIWGGVGNYMVYFLAGLQQINEDILDSAKIDGAGPLQMMVHITLPMLGPILKIIIMLCIISAFRDTTNVMVLTEGGPNNATMVMGLYGYGFYFPISASESIMPQYGYGAAVSVVSSVIIGAVTLLYLFVSKKLDEVY